MDENDFSHGLDSADEKQHLINASRHASYNASERQRRDNLFLDLASLLPNLAGVRRPSKNAILESSIAYIRSSRNLASQQLLALHTESESLRHEANEWRLWAGVPDVLEEPRRGDAFMLLTGADFGFEHVGARDDEELDEQYTSGMFPRPSGMHQHSSSHFESPSPFAYGVSPLPSASDVSPPLPTPPSSAQSSLDRNLPCSSLPTPLCPRPLGMHQRSSSRSQSPSPFAYGVSPLPSSSGVPPPLPTPPSSATSRDDDDEKFSSGEETTFDGISLVGFRSRDLSGRVKQDDKYPFAGGANSNIYRGKLTRSNGSKIRVAIKMIRMSDDGSGQHEEMLRRLHREADIWSRLKHRNILSFIGICENLAPFPVLISPFYKFGHIGKYLTKHPGVNREQLVLGVASGLQFLPENGVVHGDLKVQNVLVDKHGVPCICDFGISKVVSCRGFTTSNVGTAPYMAPELFCVVDGAGMNSHASSTPGTTPCSDVYSFALLVLEILTAEPPKGRPSRPIVTARILADLRPKRTDYDKRKVPRRTWSVLDRCWSFEPLLRPSISEVLRDLTDCFVPTPLLDVESEELMDRLVV